MQNSADARWLAAAAVLAERARPFSRPNPAVAAIIVKNGIVLGRGWTQPGGRPHAEAAALQQAGQAARGATIYVTLEPCAHASARGPACADLLVAARPAKVVAGVLDPDLRTAGAGLDRLRQAGVDAVLADDPACRAGLGGFLTRQMFGRPHVTLKLAVSADGFIAPLAGGPVQITGEIARAHVHRERARADAILVGGGTLRADRPRLDVRLPGLEQRSPHRYVLTSSAAPDGWEQLASPQAIFEMGAAQYLYVEGGAQVAQAFVAAGLADRLMIYRAPLSMDEGLAAFGALGAAVPSVLDKRWRMTDQRRLGTDRLEVYEPASQQGV